MKRFYYDVRTEHDRQLLLKKIGIDSVDNNNDVFRFLHLPYRCFMRQRNNGETYYTYARVDFLPEEFKSATRWVPDENIYDLE